LPLQSFVKITVLEFVKGRTQEALSAKIKS
jgi:hypothetical protein